MARAAFNPINFKLIFPGFGQGSGPVSWQAAAPAVATPLPALFAFCNLDPLSLLW